MALDPSWMKPEFCRRRVDIVDHTLTPHASEKATDKVLVLYSVDQCAPCDIAKDALLLIGNDLEHLGWRLEYDLSYRADKKAIGKALLAGVNQFPTVRLKSDGIILESFVCFHKGWNIHDNARFLLRKTLKWTDAEIDRVSRSL